MTKNAQIVAKSPQNRLHSVAVSQRRVRHIALIAAAMLLSCQSVSAEHWVFQPSYFSHAVAPPDRPLPSSRSSYRVPSVGNNPGFSVRGEYRVNFLRFRNGSSTDFRIQYRGNVELDP